MRVLSLFLSYARSDGLAAASRLRGELQAMGFAVWRDVEETQGGQAWKEQLRAALRQDVPAELKRLHYHDLSDPATYTLGLARLARDLLAVAAARPAPSERAMAAAKYQNITAINSVVGKNNVTINQFGLGALDAAAVAQVVTALRNQAGGDPAAQAEIAALLREMKPTLDGVAAGVRDLQAGQARLLARFDEREQRILAPILARLDDQKAEQTEAILDVLETRVFPANELVSYLAVIRAALTEIDARSAQIADHQLAESVRHIAEMATAPGLDVKHKLKVMIPILPVLAYEGEFALDSRLNLAEVWRGLRELIIGK